MLVELARRGIPHSAQVRTAGSARDTHTPNLRVCLKVLFGYELCSLYLPTRNEVMHPWMIANKHRRPKTTVLEGGRDRTDEHRTTVRQEVAMTYSDDLDGRGCRYQAWWD